MILFETIANTANNTFIGTLFAGGIIAFLGLKIYRQQKELDIAYSKRKRIQELATLLLTHVNVAVKDYLGQISVHNGANPPAKLIYNKMISISPNFISKETSSRFQSYITNITQAFNDFSTPFALDKNNESKVKILAENVPQLNFLLSTTSTLSDLQINTLNDLSKLSTEYSDKIASILEPVINS